MKRVILITCILILSFPVFQLAAQYIHHELVVDIQPETHWIKVKDTIKIPGNFIPESNQVHFLLHGLLKINSQSPDLRIKKETGELKSEFFGINTAEFKINEEIPVAHYSIPFASLEKDGLEFIVFYEGPIHHPIKKTSEEYARGFSQTPGIISDKGVYLSGSSFWVPWFNSNLVTFNLKVTMPENWSSVSQGKMIPWNQKKNHNHTIWDSPAPMDEIYLIGAKFFKYHTKAGKINIFAFLRTQDDNLANKYLETTKQYMDMYVKLIGPYPYSKFALIENFWETGYGMPSFTLLGPKIIRFPFILHSSYPHELLHNWWGNSVFVDYESGNWCEGLTVFLADHLIKEQRNQGADYRKNALQSYTNYVSKQKEFSLSEFKSRYDASSSAIGYNKSMMLFQMLRNEIGDLPFIKSIQDFYKTNRFKKASFEDLRASFEKISGKDFKLFFQQWVEKSSAPEITLSQIKSKKRANKYNLSFTLSQVQQSGDIYNLKVPVAFFLKGSKEVMMNTLDFNKKIQEFSFKLDKKPLKVQVDPKFDVFRKLHFHETPPSLSKAFGAEQVLIILPSDSSVEFQKAYRKLAESWAKESKGKIKIEMDSEIMTLPKDKAIWLLGWENKFKSILKERVNAYNCIINDHSVTISNKQFLSKKNSLIISGRHPDNPSQVILLLSTDNIDALPGLGRKLPHYGKYSYLAFEGEEPTNILKGQWEAVNSPLMVILDKNLKTNQLTHSFPKRAPLARLAPTFSSDNMMKHIQYLASEELQGRGIHTKGIHKAAEYIALLFKKFGLKPGGDHNSFFQTWTQEIKNYGSKIELKNVIGILPGKNPNFKNQAVIVCAHYDHLGIGGPDTRKEFKNQIHFGADDNSSGVSVLLELAQMFSKNVRPERSIIFICFSGEEQGLLGSRYYINNTKKEKLKNIIGVINLDTVGRLKDGQKLMVLGGNSAKEWKFIFMGVGYTTGIETEMITQDLDASDQSSFIKKGIPGIQLFSGPHKDYHKPSDTFDKIIPQGLVKVANVAKEVILYLSERKDFLTSQGSPAKSSHTPSSQGQTRKVRTGVMPDFSFQGQGVRVGAVSKDSPAHKSGLKKGDVIIRLGKHLIENLRHYSTVLKTFSPGQETTLQYLRDGKTISVTIRLEEK